MKFNPVKYLLLTLIAAGVLFSYAFLLEQKPVIYLIGDSTCANKPLDDNPERGWGQLLPNFFNPDFLIENHAWNGRSTKSFRELGHWKVVYDKLKPGDYVFIQFGHNDANIKDSTRYAEAHTAFKQNLTGYINEIRIKGAVPVLLTPVNRRKFDDKGNFIDQHGDYPDVVREVAAEMKVQLIDIHKKSFELFSKLGPEATKKIFLHVPPKVYKAVPDGKEDNTHFTRYGAIEVAKLVVEGIKELNLPFVNELKPEPVFSSRENGKIVALDYFFNHELKKNALGKEVQFHYTWEDTENSGFSKLGNLIENTGAGLYSVTGAPKYDELKNVSMYIIVDPDTPKETEKPNYISAESIDEIVKYVKNGGVLVLMGNDAGNCEFANFNKLAGKFGIHFNEVSIHKVEGTKYDMGKFDKFPKHPLFDKIKQIYLKEISTLKLSKSAKPILKEGKEVIMASSKISKGFVFAVGDPWIYNEYIDHRRLPAEYQNYEAAENLFNWLLEKCKKVR